jgi:hypothetical protein
MKWIILLFFVSPYAIKTADASEMVSGNMLHQYCQAGNNLSSDADYVNDAQCRMYILGVLDTVPTGKVTVGGYKVCTPDKVSSGQMQDVVTIWLKENPSQRHFGASGLVLAAITNAFPCPK